VRLGAKVGGRYRLTKGPIRGGMGEVWVAHDEELGRDVVLKRVRTDDGSVAGFDRLRAEARALARFHHPHVVTLYDAVRLKGPRRTTSWLVMEYVPGGSLDSRPPMSPQLAAHVGAQIADALRALHAEGIVHCDIKPGNVIAGGRNSVKLADFGAAYRVGGKETITANSSVGFTPGYAAPEVVAGRPPEPSSDVFCLGAMVYALMAGKPPGRGGHAGSGAASAVDAVDAVSTMSTASTVRETEGEPDAYAAWEAARGDVEMDADVGPLRDLLAAMLKRDPGRRPDAAEVRERLKAAAGPPEQLPPFPAREPETTLRPPGEDRIRKLLGLPVGAAAVVGATAVVVLALVAWVIASGTGDKTTAGRPTASKGVSSSVIGDPRTVDPCSLMKATAFDRFGRTELDKDYGNFDRCDVILYSGDTEASDIEVVLGNVQASELAAPTRTTGKVSVVEQPAESEECVRMLTLKGVRDTTVFVQAKLLDKPKTPLCDIADVATGIAVDRLNRGELPRRSPAPPADSLLYQDACALLDASALSVVPGIDASSPEPGFGGWTCDWHSTTSNIDVKLSFDRPALPSADNSSTTKLSGHQAVILPEDEGGGTCTVEVAGPSYIGQDGEKSVEALRATISGAGPKDRPCELAIGLARSAATRLPST
jgi:hypothetical protein